MSFTAVSIRLHKASCILLASGCCPFVHSMETREATDVWILSGTYTGETIRNTRGGLRTGSAYLDNLDVTLELDGTRSRSMPRLKAFLYGLYNNRQTFSDHLAGDAQTASNIDAPRVLRLYEAWIDWTLGATRALSLRFGLTDLNVEFDNSDARGLFLNSSFGVGHELAQTGRNGPAIFPAPALGLRAAIHPGPATKLLTAIFDGDPGDPETQSLHLGGDDGALVIAEWQHTGARLTKLALGGWHYTHSFERLDLPERTSHSSGLYALSELRLSGDAQGSRSVRIFARTGFASVAVNAWSRSTQIGLAIAQPFHDEDEESLGIGIASAYAGRVWRNAQRAQGSPVESHETTFEITYRRAVTPWLTLQPDLQLILNPGADPALGRACVVALRFEASFAHRFESMR